MSIFFDDDISKSTQLNLDTVCIGTFDGMHLGHIELLNKAKIFSNNNYSLITFLYLPQYTLIGQDYRILVDNEIKENIAKKHFAKNIVYFNFANIQKMSHEEYCHLLKDKYGVRKVVVGKDFRFGFDRNGNVDYLERYFSKENVYIVNDELINGTKVSSTQIRNNLSEGNIESANFLLGRAYQVKGTVTEGKKIGRTLGFPTANLDLLDEYRIPKNGVYGVKIKISSKEYFGMLNIGYRPTFEDSGPLKIEVHIFDFDKDIYNELMVVDFFYYIREELKFQNTEMLSKQLQNDRSEVLKKFRLQN